MANSVDPDQAAPQRSSLIWVYTVCLDVSVKKLRNITLNCSCMLLYHKIYTGKHQLAYEYCMT